MTPLLHIQHLSKQFGDYQALNQISFEVFEGEILGLIGPNGAGKTTLMECIAGLLPMDSGRVMAQGKPLSIEKRKEVMFYLPDGILPYGEQRAIAILDFFRQGYGKGQEQMQLVIQQLALEPVLTKRISALSKGYRRRFLLAIALLCPQPLLILDEPFDGFDLRQTITVMSLLREIARTRTLLLSIHQLTDAEKICDRFLLLCAGNLLGSGTLEELRTEAGMTKGNLEDVFLALT